jgi:hypothetical protein
MLRAWSCNCQILDTAANARFYAQGLNSPNARSLEESPLRGGHDVMTTPGIEALFHGPGMRTLWNSAASWGDAAFIGTGAVLALPAVVEGAAAAPVIANRVLLGPAANRVFWSGGTAVGWRAMQWAAMNEGTTLEMTPVGRGLSFLGDIAPSPLDVSQSQARHSNS